MGKRIVIFTSGGIINQVISDKLIDEVIIVDGDVEGLEDEDIKSWQDKSGGTCEAYLYSGSFELNPEAVKIIYEVYHKD